MLLGRDAQPDIVFAGDRLRWAAQGARCRVAHLSAQIRLAIGAIRRPHTPADWIAQDRRYIAQAWRARRAAQAALRQYSQLLTARSQCAPRDKPLRFG